MNIRTTLLAVAAALAVVPAHAANTALTMWNSSDIGGAVTETGLGSADIGPQNLDGITVTLSFANRTALPNQLTEANINIDNTTTKTVTFNVLAGANGYLGSASEFRLSGTILASLGGADLKGSYFVDGLNGLNGLSTTASGLDIRDFDSFGLTGPQSFSFNGFGNDKVNGPYGMGELLRLTLAPGAAVAVESMSMTAVPEPRTWALLIIGFGAMALMGYRRTSRYAA